MWQELPAILSYSFCSSTMLVANKLVMHYIPAPSLVSLIQLLACTGIILVGKMLGILQLDAVETSQLRWLTLYSGSVPFFI